MSVRALNQFAAVWYVPVGQDDTEDKTRFSLVGLTGTQQAALQPFVTIPTDPKKDIEIGPEGIGLLLRYGVVEWENFGNDGGPVAMTTPKQNQDLMPLPLQNELAAEIFTMSFLPADTKKK